MNDFNLLNEQIQTEGFLAPRWYQEAESFFTFGKKLQLVLEAERKKAHAARKQLLEDRSRFEAALKKSQLKQDELLEKIKRTNDELIAARDQNRRIESRLEKTTNETLQLQSEIRKTQEHFQNTQGLWENEKHQLARELQQERYRAQKLSDQLDEMTRERQKLIDERPLIQRKIAAYEIQQAKLELERTTVREKLKASQDEIQRAERRADEAKERYERLEQEFKKQKEHWSRAAEREETLKRAHAVDSDIVKRLQMEVGELRKGNDSMSVQLAETRRQLELSQADLVIERRRVKNFEGISHSQIEALQKSRDHFAGQVQELRIMLDALQNHQKDFAEKVRETERIEEESRRLKEQLDENLSLRKRFLKKNDPELKEKINHLVEALNQANRERSMQKLKMAGLREKIEQLAQESDEKVTAQRTTPPPFSTPLELRSKSADNTSETT